MLPSLILSTSFRYNRHGVVVQVKRRSLDQEGKHGTTQSQESGLDIWYANGLSIT